MPAVEPHPRRRRALARALVTLVATGVLVLGGPVGAQTEPTLLPPTTEEPDETTTTTPPESTTTTEAEPSPTTTRSASPTTTRQTTTTAEDSFDVGDGPDDVIDGRGADEEDVVVDGGVADDVPAETTSTERDLLVSGDGSDGAEATTTTSTTIVEVAADDGTLDEEAQIWLIVAGLVVVALLIGAWTWRYWVRTRPVTPPDDPDPSTVFDRA